MTRTEELARVLTDIYRTHKAECDKLQTSGAKGGHNARTIPGWSRSTANITRAGGLPMMRWWDGSAPTPSTAIPTCCRDEAYEAERRIFGDQQ
jgi:hypothetical protein